MTHRNRGSDRHDFFFNDPAATEIYTLSLHDALPISLEILEAALKEAGVGEYRERGRAVLDVGAGQRQRVEVLDQDRKSTTSELQSRQYLVCRLLLEIKLWSCRSTAA